MLGRDRVQTFHCLMHTARRKGKRHVKHEGYGYSCGLWEEWPSQEIQGCNKAIQPRIWIQWSNGPSKVSIHKVILYNLILLKKRPILTIGEEGGLGSFSGVGCIFSLARRGERDISPFDLG